MRPVAPGRGLYEIIFGLRFVSVPAASVTQIFGRLDLGNASATSEGGSPSDNAVIAPGGADRMQIKTGDNADNEQPIFLP